jgi:hypothetical protein
VTGRSVIQHAFFAPVVLKRSDRVDGAAALAEDGDVLDGPRRETLTLLYGEVCSSWRELVGVRFKLLALVPTVSVFALVALLTRDRAPTAVMVGICCFGIVVTTALLLYDQRNSQLHDELISRGRRIESELGVETGLFRGRPGSWGIVKHDIALFIVYTASLAAWLGALVWVLSVGL